MKKKVLLFLIIMLGFMGVVKAQTGGFESIYFPDFINHKASVSSMDVYENKEVYIRELEFKGTVLESYENDKELFSKEISDLVGIPVKVIAFKDFIAVLTSEYVNNTICSDNNQDCNTISEEIYKTIYAYDYKGNLLGDLPVDVGLHSVDRETGLFMGSSNVYLRRNGTNVSRIGEDMILMVPFDYLSVYEDDEGNKEYYGYDHLYKFNSKLKKFQYVEYPYGDSIIYSDEEDGLIEEKNYVNETMKGLYKYGKNDSLLVYGLASNDDRWAVLTGTECVSICDYEVLIFNKDKLEKRFDLTSKRTSLQNRYFEDIVLLDDFVVLKDSFNRLSFIPIDVGVEEFVDNIVYFSEGDGSIYGANSTVYFLDTYTVVYISKKPNYSFKSNKNIIYDKVQLLEAKANSQFTVKYDEKNNYYELKSIKANGKEIKVEKNCNVDKQVCSFNLPNEDTEYELVFEGVKFALLEGKDQTFKKDNLVFRAEGPLSLFKSVTVNNKELVKDKDYTLKEGSTVVTLTDSYLKSLANGKYELSINYNNDTSTKTEFTVDIPKNPIVNKEEVTKKDAVKDTKNEEVKEELKNPETVDGVKIVGIILAGLLLISLILIRKKTKKFADFKL